MDLLVVNPVVDSRVVNLLGGAICRRTVRDFIMMRASGAFLAVRKRLMAETFKLLYVLGYESTNATPKQYDALLQLGGKRSPLCGKL